MSFFQNKYQWIGLLLLLHACMASAVLPYGSAASSPLSLRQLKQKALFQNPEIQAAQQHWQAVKATISQARTLPDPTIGMKYKEMTGPGEMYEREEKYGFSQSIPFPTKLYIRGQIASKEAEKAEEAYLAIRLQIVKSVKEIYYKLYLVNHSIQILEHNKLLLINLEKIAQAHYAVAKASQQDVFRAQTEITRLISRLLMLKQERESLLADMNRLLNRPPAAPLFVSSVLHYTTLHHSLLEFNAKLEKVSPLFLMSLKNVQRSERAVALAKNDYLPDFEVGVMRMNKKKNTVTESGYEVGLNVKIPLYFTSKQNQGVREAVANRESALENLQNLREELLFQIKDNILTVKRTNEIVALIKNTLISQSYYTFTSAKASYVVGKVDFLTLLDSLLTLQENELELLSEQAEHEKAIARLEGILGEQL